MNFYKSAALALDYLDKNQGSVKGSLAAAGVKTSSPGEAKRLLALVIETLKYRQVLTQILETVPLLSLERDTFPRKTPYNQPSSKSLILVMLHDLLFSSRARIEASDKWLPKPAVLRHQARLKSELVRIQLKEGKSRKEELGKRAGGDVDDGARYIRFNPNIDGSRVEDWSLPALHRHLQNDLGFEFQAKGGLAFPIAPKSYGMDAHLGDAVLVFSPGTSWWVGDRWYQAGAIILQDKASCFPAKVIMDGWEEEEGDCIDATAAPGNKTSYMSALMRNKGKLHAFERSEGRYKTLEKMLATAGCKNVLPRRADFTDTNPQDPTFKRVTRILLDPSCSGSGIVNRLDYLLDDETDETDAKAERLEKLAGFQLQMILHALKFPSVKRIVYSTCSIHPEEDEHVVRKALESKVAKEKGWTLAPRADVLPTWHRRGRAEEIGGDKDLAEALVRCLPEDRTNGFFVACLVIARPQPPRKKRAASEVQQEEEEGENVAEEAESDGEDATHPAAASVSSKPKTQSQLERARRKKQNQKKRKINA